MADVKLGEEFLEGLRRRIPSFFLALEETPFESMLFCRENLLFSSLLGEIFWRVLDKEMRWGLSFLETSFALPGTTLDL